MFDENQLDHGIRDVVMALRAAGFETTDSGDGSKYPTMEGALPFPHVAILASPDLTHHGVRNVARAILAVVVSTDKRDGWQVDAQYSTSDDAMVFLAMNAATND